MTDMKCLLKEPSQSLCESFLGHLVARGKIYDLMFKYHRDFIERNQSGLGTCSSSSFASAFPAVRSCTHSPNEHWMRLMHCEPSTLGIVSVNSQVTCLLHWLTHEFQGSRNCFLSSTVSQMPRTRLRERSANVHRPCKPTPLACACKQSFTGTEPRFLSGSATTPALNNCRRLWPTNIKLYYWPFIVSLPALRLEHTRYL